MVILIADVVGLIEGRGGRGASKDHGRNQALLPLKSFLLFYGSPRLPFPFRNSLRLYKKESGFFSRIDRVKTQQCWEGHKDLETCLS